MNDIEIFKGNDLIIELTIIDDEATEPNTPLNLAQYATVVITMYVLKTPNDSISSAIITKVGTIINPSTGRVKFIITPADTRNTKLKKNTEYTTDFIAVLDSFTYTVLRTEFSLLS
jgi:hypothetical protein